MFLFEISLKQRILFVSDSKKLINFYAVIVVIDKTEQVWDIKFPLKFESIYKIKQIKELFESTPLRVSERFQLSTTVSCSETLRAFERQSAF